MQDGKLSLAEKAMVKSLDILGQSCPGCMFEQFVGESNLGLLRMKQGKFAEADRLLTHVLALEEKYLIRDGSDTASCPMAWPIRRRGWLRRDPAWMPTREPETGASL